MTQRWRYHRVHKEVVTNLVNAIHRINPYPADSVVCFASNYLLDSNLSCGWRYPAFEQPEPCVRGSQ